MTSGSPRRPSSSYCPSSVYAYTPLFSLDSQDDSDDRLGSGSTSFTHTSPMNEDQSSPSVDPSPKRFKPTKGSHSPAMVTNTTDAKDCDAPEQCETSATTASEDIIPEIEALDEEWHTRNSACLQQIASLRSSAFRRWQAYDSTWQNIELYQYQHYESIYRSQRIKLQHQLQSVLNNDHPVLLDMDSEHDQCKRDMDLQMDFRVTNADEMLRWEKATIDREHEAEIKNLDNELLDYLSEKKRFLLIEGESDTEIPKESGRYYPNTADHGISDDVALIQKNIRSQ